MRKIFIVLSFMVIAIGLMACKNDEITAKATIEMHEEESSITSLVFTVTIIDENNDITGNIEVLLLKSSNGTQVSSRTMTQGTESSKISFTGLEHDTKYTIRIRATIGRRVVILLEQDQTTNSDGEVIISTIEEFLAMRAKHTGKYILANDLDFADVSFTTPFTSSFIGTFDGQGYTLKNINITGFRTNNGVFGYVDSGTIKDVVLENVNIGASDERLTSSSQTRVGIVVGYQSGATGVIENVTVKNSNIYIGSNSTSAGEAATSAAVQAGIIAGYAGGTIKDVTVINSNIDVKSTNYGTIKIGGVVGQLGLTATLNNAIADVDITFDLNIASLITDKSTVIYIGGLIGDSNSRKSTAVKNVSVKGDITVTDLKYNISDTTKTGNHTIYVGGLFGMNYANVNGGIYQGNIDVNYEAMENDKLANHSINVGGLAGLNATSIVNVLRAHDTTISVNVSPDFVTSVRLSQGIANNTSTKIVSVYLVETTNLVLNGESKAITDQTPLIQKNDISATITNEWVLEQFIENFS